MAVSYLALLCKEKLWNGQDSQNFIGGNLQRCDPGLHLMGRLNSEKPLRTLGERTRTQVSCPLALAWTPTSPLAATSILLHTVVRSEQPTGSQATCSSQWKWSCRPGTPISDSAGVS